MKPTKKIKDTEKIAKMKRTSDEDWDQTFQRIFARNKEINKTEQIRKVEKNTELTSFELDYEEEDEEGERKVNRCFWRDVDYGNLLKVVFKTITKLFI